MQFVPIIASLHLFQFKPYNDDLGRLATFPAHVELATTHAPLLFQTGAFPVALVGDFPEAEHQARSN